MSKKIKYIIAALLCLIAAAALGLFLRPQSAELVSVQEGPMQETFTETAELYARERIAFYATGQSIATVHVQTGDRVAAGSVLVTYKSAHDQQLASLQAQRQAAAAQYNAAKTDAQLRLADIERTLSTAGGQYDRQQKLYQAGALSQQELENDANALEELRSQQTSAKEAYDAAARQEAAQLAQIDASVALLAVQNDDAIITAPFSGLITECPAQGGTTLPAGSLILELQAPDDLYLQAELLTEDAARLTPDTLCRAENSDYQLTLDDLAVTAIAPKAIDTISTLGVSQKRLPIEIALPQAPPAVPLESQWEVTFITATEDHALWLPKSCVYTRQGQSYVLLPDGKTEQPVSTGIRQDDRIQITDGLSLGDQVAVPNQADA